MPERLDNPLSHKPFRIGAISKNGRFNKAWVDRRDRSGFTRAGGLNFHRRAQARRAPNGRMAFTLGNAWLSAMARFYSFKACAQGSFGARRSLRGEAIEMSQRCFFFFPTWQSVTMLVRSGMRFLHLRLPSFV